MHLYKESKKWWDPPTTRAEAIEEARYYMWCMNAEAAFAIIVALCASVDQKGTDKYDEALEQVHVTAYQKRPTSSFDA